MSPLRLLRNLGRTREIVLVLLNHGFGDLVERLGLLRYLRWWNRVVLRRGEGPPSVTAPERIRLVLEELGPTFVKFGQMASTRPDLVPPGVIAQLQRLQERVAAFSSDEAVALVENELGGSLDQLFSWFDRSPLAAGSLGQVHRARLPDGTEVAVKIRRPHAARDVERDLALMSELAGLIEAHIPEAEVFDPQGLVQQFARSIRRELSFQREGRTIDEFRRHFSHDASLVLPRVYWDRTSEGVLTMDYLEGLSIGDTQGLKDAGYQTELLAANGARVFLKMAFELGLFHGDPHPGNLRVLPGGVLGLIDFGMVGRLEPDKRELLVDLLASVAHRDVTACVNLILQIGRPSRPVDRPLLQADVRDFIETFYGVPLDRVDMRRLLGDFVTILSTHGIRYPADLMLLFRAIVTLESVGRQLDPQFNLSVPLRPFVERMIRERYSPGQMVSRALLETRTVAGIVAEIPRQLGRTLGKLSSDDLRIQLEHRHLEHLISELDRSGNRIVTGMVMSALILATALIIRAGGPAPGWLAGAAFILSSVLGVWLIVGIFRSGRL